MADPTGHAGASVPLPGARLSIAVEEVDATPGPHASPPNLAQHGLPPAANDAGEASDGESEEIGGSSSSPMEAELTRLTDIQLSNMDTRRWSTALPDWMAFARKKAIAELMVTEELYIKGLETLLDGYMHQLGPELLSEEEKRAIFVNMDELLLFHRTLYDGLQAATIKDASALPQAGPCWRALTPDPSIFIQSVPTFKELYGIYCSEHPRSLQVLEQRQRDPDFQAHLDLCQQRLSQQLSLKDDLLKPVQRIMKYHLLLAEQLKNARPEQPGHATLVTAVSDMKAVAQSINQASRQQHLARLVHGDIELVRTPQLSQRLEGLPCPFSELGELRDEITQAVFSQEGHKQKGKGSGRILLFFDFGIVSCKLREHHELSVKEFYELGTCVIKFLDPRSFTVTATDTEDDGPTYFLRNIDVQARLGWMLDCNPVSDSSKDKPRRNKTVLKRLLGRDRINSAGKINRSEAGGNHLQIHLHRTLTVPNRPVGPLSPGALMRTATVTGGARPLRSPRSPANRRISLTDVALEEESTSDGADPADVSEATTLEEYARQQKLLLQRIQSLQEELQTMQDSERLLLEDREDMRIQLDACAEVAQAAAEGGHTPMARALRKAWTKEVEANRSLEASLRKATEELQKTRGEQTATLKQLEALQEDLNMQREELTATQATLATTSEQHRAAVARAEEATRTADALHAELAQLRAHGQVDGQLEALQQELASLRAENGDLRSKMTVKQEALQNVERRAIEVQKAMTTEIDELSGERSHPSSPSATVAQPSVSAKAGKISFRNRSSRRRRQAQQAAAAAAAASPENATTTPFAGSEPAGNCSLM